MGEEDDINHHSDPGQRGEHGDGTAAKSSDKRESHPMSLVRKSIRIRTRMLPEKSSQPDTVASPARSSFSTTSQEDAKSIITSHHEPAPLTHNIDLQAAAIAYELRVGTRPLSDLSGYLPTPSRSCEEMPPATTQGPDAFCHTTSHEDIWGWEAELERRTQGNDFDSFPLTYRRANGTRANLLQRVFKAGSP